MIRVSGGALRGRRIPVPPGEVRPTSERARQAYFDIVGERLAGARFLDLFAGSGIFSFEAVSRGAAEAVAVDASSRNTAAIARIAAGLQVPVRALTADLPSGMNRLGQAVFQLLYADPPYGYSSHRELLEAIDGQAPLAVDAVAAIEHRRRTDPFPGAALRRLERWRRAEYGEVWITFFIARGELLSY